MQLLLFILLFASTVEGVLRPDVAAGLQQASTDVDAVAHDPVGPSTHDGIRAFRALQGTPASPTKSPVASPSSPKASSPRTGSPGQPSSPTTGSSFPGFVSAHGTRLMLNGRCFFFHGANNWFLGPAFPGNLKANDIDRQVQQHAKAGIKVLRVWGYARKDDLEWKSDGTFTLGHKAFDQMDRVVYAAGKYGVKLVFPFINFEEDILGMRFYVQKAGLGETRELFYASSKVWRMYTHYVQSIVNRYNPLTRKLYKNDPAIMTWEVANEPHTTDNFESKWHGKTLGDLKIKIDKRRTGTLAGQFICRAAKFIKSAAPKQMVASGEEGYKASGKVLSKWRTWLDNGLKGVDFPTNARCRYLDYMTVHVYPDNWKISYTDFEWTTDVYMRDRRDIAHRAGKPIVLEEYGCCKQPDYKGKRGEVAKAFHKAVRDLGYAGLMTWALAGDSAFAGFNNNYGFSYGDVDGKEVVNSAAAMNNKSKQAC